MEEYFYLYTGNYIIVETLALSQGRLGFVSANLWYRDVLNLAEILWIDDSMHNLAYELWLSLGRTRSITLGSYLSRLFEEMREPAQDEIFVERVSNRIVRLKRYHRVLQILIVLAGMAIFGILTPWVIDLTIYIALGSTLFANSIVLAVLSPVGWVIGGGVGLGLFLQTRSKLS